MQVMSDRLTSVLGLGTEESRETARVLTAFIAVRMGVRCSAPDTGPEGLPGCPEGLPGSPEGLPGSPEGLPGSLDVLDLMLPSFQPMRDEICALPDAAMLAFFYRLPEMIAVGERLTPLVQRDQKEQRPLSSHGIAAGVVPEPVICTVVSCLEILKMKSLKGYKLDKYACKGANGAVTLDVMTQLVKEGVSLDDATDCMLAALMPRVNFCVFLANGPEPPTAVARTAFRLLALYRTLEARSADPEVLRASRIIRKIFSGGKSLHLLYKQQGKIGAPGTSGASAASTTDFRTAVELGVGFGDALDLIRSSGSPYTDVFYEAPDASRYVTFRFWYRHIRYAHPEAKMYCWVVHDWDMLVKLFGDDEGTLENPSVPIVYFLTLLRLLNARPEIKHPMNVRAYHLAAAALAVAVEAEKRHGADVDTPEVLAWALEGAEALVG
jgi:hypothetical protein